MKYKIYFIIVFFCMASAAYSQNVAINSSGTPASAAAILDLSNNANLGLLLPNVSLTSINDQTTIPATLPDGLIVYNSNPSLPFGVGIYYWSVSSSKWLFLSNAGNPGLVTS